MKNNTDELQLKLKDYRRFLITLLMLASYLYFGAFINTYINYSPDGSALTILAFVTTVAASVLSYQTYRMKIRIEENERV